MVTRFNFGTEQSSTSGGYVIDFGEAYSPSVGYGWVEQEDLTTPLNVIPNARERNLSGNQLLDSFIHMQYPSDIPNPDAVTTPAAWVYDVKNGRYRISVGVGDPFINDSIHTINVEDETIISSFEPDSDSPTRFGSGIVDVTDGQLTVNAIGGENTKINSIEFDSVSSAWINFGTRSTRRLDGYIKDIGQGYSDNIGYGWVTQESLSESDTEAINITTNTRERSLVGDIVSDSFIHMQYPEFAGDSNAVTTPAAWEYSLPDGRYRVTVEVGDSGFTDSNHVINVEDINFVNGFTPTTDNLFEKVTRIVDVSDGKLTIDAIGGENTKLTNVRIDPVTDVKINFGPENTTVVPDEYYSDYGLAYSGLRGYGWVTQLSAGTDNPVGVDISNNTRFRFLGEDPLRKSLIHMQYPRRGGSTTANRTSAAWEYAIPNGQYEVTVGVGDPSFVDSIHEINIEGVDAISDFIPRGGELFATATEIVEIIDGRLTVDAIGGENTKLNFVEIASID